MHFLKTVRILFIVFATVSAFIFCSIYDPGSGIGKQLIWGAVGLIISLLIVAIESQIHYVQPKELIVGMAGLVFGLTVAQLLFNAMPFISPNDPSYNVTRVMLHLFLSYLGLAVALRFADRISFTGSKLTLDADPTGGNKKFLDTSVLIDGRIADIVDTGFLEGQLTIPSFVLRELQMVADSSDPIRRKRGRRGLDIVKRLQESRYPVSIVERSVGTQNTEVDDKLVLLAKEMHGAIITNDFNLNKVATIQDIIVLNINDLANALRPVILPGEDMTLLVLKEGKEEGQGIGYLDDGTMVVVDDGIHYLGRQTDVQVTSVLQTAAGRMIFAKPANHLRGDTGR